MWYAAADKIVLVISAVYHYWDHRGIFQTFQLDHFALLIAFKCRYFFMSLLSWRARHANLLPKRYTDTVYCFLFSHMP